MWARRSATWLPCTRARALQRRRTASRAQANHRREGRAGEQRNAGVLPQPNTPSRASPPPLLSQAESVTHVSGTNSGTWHFSAMARSSSDPLAGSTLCPAAGLGGCRPVRPARILSPPGHGPAPKRRETGAPVSPPVTSTRRRWRFAASWFCPGWGRSAPSPAKRGDQTGPAALKPHVPCRAAWWQDARGAEKGQASARVRSPANRG